MPVRQKVLLAIALAALIVPLTPLPPGGPRANAGAVMGEETSIPVAQRTALSVGAGQACLVRTDGTLECWGANDWGEAVAPDGTYVSVSAGYEDSCAIASDGTIHCWGRGNFGEILNVPAGRYVSVSDGLHHACAVAVDGSVSCWGEEAPKLHAPAGTYVAVAAGGEHTCAIRTGGSLACWGSDGGHQLGAPAGTFVALAAATYYSCAIRAIDLTIACWGTGGPVATAPAGSYVAVSAGWNVACALSTAGTVACWGQSGAVPGPAGEIVVMAMGGAELSPMGCWIAAGGGVTCGGASTFNETYPSRAVDVSTSPGHTCAIRQDGTLACWGNESNLPWDPPSGSYVAVSAGLDHACAIRTDGTIACWGVDFGGSTTPPDGRYLSVSAAAYFTCAVSTAHSLTCWGPGDPGLAGVPAGTDFVAVSVDETVACALRIDGTIACWGDNTYGRATPPSGVYTAVSVGGFLSCAIQVNGIPACWGQAPSSIPQSAIVAGTAGTAHYCAIGADGSIGCLGSNDYGQASPPAGRFVDISANHDHTCAVRDDGWVTCWGLDEMGETNVPIPGAAPTGVSAIPGVDRAHVSWSAPVDQVPSIVGYTVTASPGGQRCTTATLSCTVTGLGAGVSYTYAVVASNGLRTGPSQVRLKMEAPVPWVAARPNTLKVTVVSDSGATVTGYRGTIQFSTSDPAATPPSSYQFTATDAGVHSFPFTLKTLGTQSIDAADTVAAGIAGTLSAINVITVPGKPTGVTAVRGNGQVLVSWTAPASNGSPITSYAVTSSPAGGACTTSGLSCSITGLTLGTAYTFRVKATNAAGAGPLSDPSPLVTAAAIPGKPTGVAATAANGSASVRWTAAPANGATITSYTVTSTPGSKQCVTATTSCTVPGLTNGTTYTFTVRATNRVGTGVASAASNPVRPIGPTARFRVTSAATATPRTPRTMTVVALDSTGAVTTAYRGTVHFTSTDPFAALPADHAFTAADAGTHTFSMTFNTAGSQSVTVRDAAATSISGGQSIAVSYAAATYRAIGPARVLDTRPTAGGVTNIGLSGTFRAGVVRSFKVAGVVGVGGSAVAVPANATAVTGNLTIVGQTASGVVALGPTMTASGPTTMLTIATGDIRAVNVTLALGSGGSLSAVYRATSGATTNLIFDVTGYFLPDNAGARYHPLTPGRVLDSRPTSGGVTNIGLTGKFATGAVRTFKVAGVKGIGWTTALVPTTATAVTGNLTVTNATSDGFVAVGPVMTSAPKFSTLNTKQASTRANAVTIALRSGSLQAVWMGRAGSSADLIFDVTGYFTADGSGLAYHPIAPVRLLNTPASIGLSGAFATNVPRTLQLAGVNQVPAGARGISGNVTLSSPTSAGFGFVGPAPVPARPKTSTLNTVAKVAVANGVNVGLSAGGALGLVWAGTAASTVQMALDVTGYWQ